MFRTIKRWRFLLAFLALSALSVGVRWPFLSYPLNEVHGFRQAQTALMIREYMDSGLLQLSPLPVFGPPWQFPMEFPAFQWIAAVVGNVVGTNPQLAGRGMALACFLASAGMTAWLARRWYSEMAGYLVMALFLFLPFGFQWSIAPMIEFLAVAFGLLWVIAVVQLLESGRRWHTGLFWGVAVIGSVGAYLVKPTTAVPYTVIVMAVLVSSGIANLRRWRQQLSNWLAVLASSLIGLAAGFLWTQYSDDYKERSPYTEFSTSWNLVEWNFGTIEQRLDAANWARIGDYGDAIVASMALFAVLLVAAVALSNRPIVTLGLATAAVVGPLIFFNLYYMHSYYLAAVYSPIVIVLGSGLSSLATLAVTKARQIVASTTAVLSLLALAWISPEGQAVSNKERDGLYSFPLAEELASLTEVDAGIVMIGCDWDPMYFYLSGRRGLMLRAGDQYLGTPLEWIPSEINYLARCDSDLDPRDFLPSGVRAEPISPDVFHLTRFGN